MLYILILLLTDWFFPQERLGGLAPIKGKIKNENKAERLHQDYNKALLN